MSRDCGAFSFRNRPRQLRRRPRPRARTKARSAAARRPGAFLLGSVPLPTPASAMRGEANPSRADYRRRQDVLWVERLAAIDPRNQSARTDRCYDRVRIEKLQDRRTAHTNVEVLRRAVEAHAILRTTRRRTSTFVW